MGNEDWYYLTTAGSSSSSQSATAYQWDQYQQQLVDNASKQQLDRWSQLQSIKLQPGKICSLPELQQLKEGIEMKGLYDVYLVYGEDRKMIIKKVVTGVLADSDEDAKIKSGLMKEIKDDWDADYLTFIVRKIGDVKVKEKPKEVKQV